MAGSELSLSIEADAVSFPLLVIPGASRNALLGVVDGALKVRVSAPPVDGAANVRCLKYLAKDVLGVPVSRLSLDSGERSRRKRVRVQGVSEAEVRARVTEALGR